MNVTFSHGGSEACGTDGVLGYLSHQDDGSVLFVSEDDDYFFSENGPVSHVAFYGLNGELLYEATGENGGIVGEVFPDYNDGLVFLSELTYLDDPTENTVAFTEAPLNTPVTEMPTEAPTEAPTDAGYVLYNAIPSQGAYVGNVCYTDRNSSSTFSISTQTGFLSYNADGAVIFRTIHPSPVLPDGDTFYQIAFYGTDGTLLYEASREAGVGQFYLDENGYLYFTSCMEALSAEAEAPTAEYIPPITIPDTTTATEVVDTPVDIPRETIIAELTDPTEVPDATVATMPPMDIPDETTATLDFSDEIISTYYYDHDLGQQVQATFIYEDMPETYTVELYLLPGAYEMDAVYDLIVWIWGYRNEMLYVLGVSLFLFAVCAVYLCCSAGRKPGREEIRAGGFNCLSLDVYLGAGGLAVCGLAIIGFEGGYYLLRYSPQLLTPFVIIMGYSAALIIVGFCFACAAQFKTPGGYWWKNTLTVRCFNLGIQLVRWCVRYFFRFMRWLEEFLGKLFPQLGRIMKYCWKTFIQLCLAVYRYTEKGLTWAGHFLGGVFRSVSAWIHRFLVLLPVTWQWLIIGGMLLFVLFLAILTRSEFFIVLGVLAGLALIIYGSHCFGILLESTKRMGKGDLETKVDDKLMVGAFREFAGDLNNLADVAVIAAQKQMKSERMKAELITNVSHDIKTPLTSIINYVDLLQKPHTDEEQETYLEVLSRQSQQMKKLLEDLIEMSKASTGNMTVNISRINAGEAVTQALGEFAGKLETAQLTTVVHQPEDAVYMQADGRLVWRVLSNLLSNAVKYALPGTRVYIDVMELDGKVLISMKNISREALNVSADELMERFVRGDASRNTEGSGLGLNIAQSLMEIQKGKLQLLVDGDLFKVTLVFPGANE